MSKKNKENKIKILMISSSGGHYEQLKMLKPLEINSELIWITEKTKYYSESDYKLLQTGSKDKLFILKMLRNLVGSLIIWWKEKPDLIITTGTVVALPMCLIAKLTKKKIIFIETYARVNDGTKAGKMMYKYSDLFIVQWESLKKIYPEATYGGSIY